MMEEAGKLLMSLEASDASSTMSTISDNVLGNRDAHFPGNPGASIGEYLPMLPRRTSLSMEVHAAISIGSYLLGKGDEVGGARGPAGAAGHYGRRGVARLAALAAVVHEAVLAAPVRHEVLRLLLHRAPMAHLLCHHLQRVRITAINLQQMSFLDAPAHLRMLCRTCRADTHQQVT